ncbi:MAG: dipeptide epimerase, partial [Halobacteriaceae archaeon]
FAGAPSAKFAIETALVDAYCREQNIALAELFGGKPEPVTTDMTIGIMTPEEAVKQANQATSQGFEHLKIKTGNDVDNDIERVVAVAEAAPNASLKVDANQGWTPKETAKFAEQISDRGVSLDLIEQPVPKSDLQGLADTRKRVNIPIAADETVFTPGDAIDVVREQAADIINAKLGKSGLLSVVDISAIATAANLELMIGCMLESAIGIHTSAHLVAGNGRFNYIDLDGNLFHETDVTTIDRGPTHEISGPGHGIIPDFE